MVVIKKIIRTIIWLPKYLYVLLNKKKLVVCESFLKFKGTKFTHQNWGDDMNAYFFEQVTGKKFVFLRFRDTYLPKISHYSLIGSTLGYFNLDKTIVYGSGIYNPDHVFKGKPEKIISVRGPLTRKVLIEKGFDCPEKYGDPALLLPLFYNKKRETKYKVSIIPHCDTINEELIGVLRGKFHIIKMNKYKKWTDVIDEILDSEIVLSESLHGLIVCETYGVKSQWVEFIDHNFKHWDFKFNDFYLSINKENVRKMKISSLEDALLAIECANISSRSNINYDELLSLFPFETTKEAGQLK